MKTRSIAVLLSIVLMSCASTRLVSTWKNVEYSGNVRNVLVIVIAEKPAVRRVFEREYVMQLKGQGVDAVPSHEIIPADEKIDKETILSKIEGLGIDSVLISSLVSKKTVTTAYSGYPGYSGYTGWYGYYSENYNRTYTDDIVDLETSLYDVKSEKMIWTALSETTILEGESSFSEIQPFVEIILKNLSEDKLI